MSTPPKSEFKKVLMISRTFPPFMSVGHSIRVVKFIKFLPMLGWLPVVLTIDDQMEYETTRKLGSETLLSEIQPQVKICRSTAGEPSLKFLEKETEFNQRNCLTSLIAKVLGGTRRWALRNIFLPDRYLAWLPFALNRARQIMRSEGIDVIFATCPPYSVMLISTFLKLFTGKPLVLDFRDDWVDTPWYHSRSKISRMIERKMESWVVKTADKIILVTEWSRKAYLDRYPKEPNNKFVLIPNGCDLDEFSVLNSMAVSPRKSKFTMVHAGSLNNSKNWTRTPTSLFQAIHHILQQQPELAEELTLVFAGDLPKEFQILAEELGFSDMIKWLGYLPHDDVLSLLKSADLLLAIATDHFSTVIPGKLYEYWAVGGPPILLISYPGAAVSLVEKYSLGLTVEPSDVTGIQEAIMTVYQKSKTATPLTISTAGIEAYDRQELTRKLAQTLSIVCNQK